MKKYLGVFIILVLVFIATMCRPPSKMFRGSNHTEVYTDTIFDGGGNVVTIKKHSEKNERRDTYYYTIFALVLVTAIVIISKSKN